MHRERKKILSLLQEDARLSTAKIAAMLKISEEDAANEIAKMEDEGLIVKYTTVVNMDKTGEDYVDALIEVKVTPQPRSGFDAIAEEIYKLEEVKAVYLMSGTYDLAITIESRTMRDISLFVSERLSTIDCVVGTTTHFIMKKYKEGGVILSQINEGKRLSVHE